MIKSNKPNKKRKNITKSHVTKTVVVKPPPKSIFIIQS